MSEFDFLSGGAAKAPGSAQSVHEYQTARLALHRVMEFTGISIDDVINDPIARNHVLGYYRLCLFVERRCDEIGLERRGHEGKVAM